MKKWNSTSVISLSKQMVILRKKHWVISLVRVRSTETNPKKVTKTPKIRLMAHRDKRSWLDFSLRNHPFPYPTRGAIISHSQTCSDAPPCWNRMQCMEFECKYNYIHIHECLFFVSIALRDQKNNLTPLKS